MHPETKSPALIPTTTRPLPLAVAAKGARIFDSSGLDYIDASSGPLAVSVGHGHPKVAEALRRQFASVDYVHRSQFRNEAAERLADLVTARLGGGLDHVLFVGSGSEANEIAMKFAHLYWAVQGRGDKYRFASSSLSYHGNTLGALSASGQPRYAAPYRPLVQPGERITAPSSTGCRFPRAAPPRPSASPGSATTSRTSTPPSPRPSCWKGSAAPRPGCWSRRPVSLRSSAASATPTTSSGSATR
jgi:adenosylmethionine-8-amino-7-oxononanoate aminotransferase